MTITKNNNSFFLVCLIMLIFCLIIPTHAQDTYNLNRELDFNFDWKFTEVDEPALPKKIPLNDSKWRSVRLPHDWSVEHEFDKKWDGATGYLPGGVGIYQKHFTLDYSPSDKSTFILFDGVYNNATFWLNGKKIGENPYGYSPTYFDLSPYLNEKGIENIITVHVDHSRYVDSRWYSGSGIYRNVKLLSLNKTHIPIWGTFIHTPEVSKAKAKVALEIKIKNSDKKQKKITLETVIIDPEENQVATQSQTTKVSSQGNGVINQQFNIVTPALWHFNSPNMYKAVTTLKQGNKVIDTYETPFGIRKLEFIAKKGFFLNGENTLIKGVCLHHDGGLVGAAVPKGVWKRRLQKLKDAGVNGIRTSHNPFSQEFLDLCDEMGFLVQDEIFDEFDYPKDKRKNYHDRTHDDFSKGYTEHFQKWGKSDLTRSILRDRNHPSVIQWSIGNEIEWTYLHYRFITGFWKDPSQPQKMEGYWSKGPMFTPEELKARYNKSKKGKYILVETAKRLNGWVKELDPTRTTAANLIIPQVSHVSGYADAVDIAGYSYRNVDIAWGQKHFPNKQITITECPGTWNDWKHVLENPGVYSMYMWTGIGYIGERYNDWPSKSGWSDMLDIAGFKVQGWNYFKSIWVDKPHVSIGTLPLEESGFKKNNVSGQQLPENAGSYNWRDSNMHWNYKEGQDITVEVASNYPIVELLINGRSLGFKSMSESPDRLFRWVVPYEKGILTARGTFNGKTTATSLTTSKEASDFKVTIDKSSLKADAYDVSHLVVQLYDKDGVPVKTENKKVTFEIIGEVKLLGVDTGMDDNIHSFQSNNITTAKGRCLAIVQSKKQTGTAKIKIKVEDLGEKEIELKLTP